MEMLQCILCIFESCFMLSNSVGSTVLSHIIHGSNVSRSEDINLFIILVCPSNIEQNLAEFCLFSRTGCFKEHLLGN